MTQHGRFSSSTALVTGAGRGIGAACARRLADEGARVVVTDLDLDAAREVVASLPDGSGRHLALTMDVTNRTSVDQTLGHAARELDLLQGEFGALLSIRRRHAGIHQREFDVVKGRCTRQ